MGYGAGSQGPSSGSKTPAQIAAERRRKEAAERAAAAQQTRPRNKAQDTNFFAGESVPDPIFPWVGNTARRAPEAKDDSAAWIRNPLNFLGDMFTGGTRNARESIGTGFGDFLTSSVSPGYYGRANANPVENLAVYQNAFGGTGNKNPVAGGSTYKPIPGGLSGVLGITGQNARSGGGVVTDPGTDNGWTPLGLQDALDQVRAMMKADGYDDGSVSYDPLRAAARSQWSDADARTLAMYQQLQSAIAGDAGTLNQTYDQAVTNTNDATAFANKQNTESAQAMNSMQSQQAAALGIQEAVGNDIQAGNYAARDALQRTEDTTARGQITSNLMNSNRASALDYNTDLVGAAGLQGAMVRNQRQNELNKMLAQYDVEEQAANRQAAQNRQQQEFSLAQFLMGTNRSDRDSENALQRGMTQDANQSDQFWAQFYADQAGGASGGGYDRERAWAQALQDYNFEPGDNLDDDQRAKVIKAMQFYMNL